MRVGLTESDYIYIYIYMCVCVCVKLNIYIHTYIYIQDVAKRICQISVERILDHIPAIKNENIKI